MPAATSPPSLTSFPIYHATRQCTSCRLHRQCIAPVPGVGPVPAQIMVVGESPGEREDETGVPFTGQTGRLLNHLLDMAGLQRTDVYLTNITKCPTTNEAPPHLVAHCAKEWLDGLEMGLVQPRYVVAMGQAAIRHILDDPTLTVEHTHGIPHFVDGPRGAKSVVVFPTYNPAAGLRTTAQLRPIWSDWQVLGRILGGEDPSNYVPTDYYPDPHYIHVTNARDARELLHLPEYALDTETVPIQAGEQGRALIGASATGIGTDPTGRPHRLWSVQISNRAGEAYFISAELIPDPATAIPKTSVVYVHNYLYDRQFIGLPNFVDTMLAAYLLGLPQGLKQLAYRMAGMEMRSYSEYVETGEESVRMAAAYLAEVIERGAEWPTPEPLASDKWSDKLGTVTRVMRQPNPIASKAKRALSDREKDPAVDLGARWKTIDARERKAVEAALGPMPEPSLVDVDFGAAMYYASRDADATWRIKEPLLRGIQESNLSRVLYGIDLPVLDQLAEMMDTGITVDTDHLQALSIEYLAQLRYSAAKCAVVGGRGPFNPNSSEQVAALLYDPAPGLGFPATRRTKTGTASTEERELKKVDHPVVAEILDYRGILKNKTTYADRLIEQAHPVTKRIHTTFRPTRTETGRLSSADPNLQNVPIRTAEGRRIREAFVAQSPEHILLALDYSQIEMRVMAHLSRSPALIQAFIAGLDMHAFSAARTFEVAYDLVESWQRRVAKSLNFGVIYGITSMGLYEYLIEQGVVGWEMGDCERLLRDYKVAMPEIDDFAEQQSSMARRLGYVESMFGRRRYMPELACPIPRIREEGKRAAGNMPVQSTAQDIIKMAGNRIWHLRETGQAPADFSYLLQVHDEIVFEVLDRDAHILALWLKHLMESIVSLDVPVIVDAKAGRSWGSMEEMNLGERRENVASSQAILVAS